MVVWVWLHASHRPCVVWVSIKVVWIRHKGRSPMSTGRHIQGPLRDTLSSAVTLVSDVNSAVVHKPLTEFEPISPNALYLHVFNIVKGDRSGNKRP